MTDKASPLDRTNARAVLTALNEGNSIDAKRVDASIRYVTQTGAKLLPTIHATAVACIHLSMPHIDGGHNCAIRATNLVNAMPKGTRVKALVAWFAAFSNIRLVWDKKLNTYKGGVLKPEAKAYVQADPGGAMLKPFWTPEEKDVDPAVFTDSKFATAIANLIARAKGSNATLDAKGLAVLADLEAVALKLPVPAKA